MADFLGGPLVMAQAAIADPRQIALTVDDLPAGFVVDPERTEQRELTDPSGVLYNVVMHREDNDDANVDGLSFVGQQVARLDNPDALTDFMDRVRNQATSEDGFQMVSGAPNDGGTATLAKDDADQTDYEVAFIKRDMLVVTYGGSYRPSACRRLSGIWAE